MPKKKIILKTNISLDLCHKNLGQVNLINGCDWFSFSFSKRINKRKMNNQTNKFSLNNSACHWLFTFPCSFSTEC